MSEPVLMKGISGGTQLWNSDGTSVILDEKAYDILNRKCLENGSSAQGRMDSFRYVLSIRQKAAVMVSEITQEIWFPTVSMSAADCIWIRFDQILSVHSMESSSCTVTFFSGLKVNLDIDIRIIRLQMKRCSAYMEALSGSRSVSKDPLHLFKAAQ